MKSGCKFLKESLFVLYFMFSCFTSFIFQSKMTSMNPLEPNHLSQWLCKAKDFNGWILEVVCWTLPGGARTWPQGFQEWIRQKQQKSPPFTSSRLGGETSDIFYVRTIIFFKWVGTTTNWFSITHHSEVVISLIENLSIIMAGNSSYRYQCGWL